MSMNDNKYQNIEELLPRFCDGLTTEEESMLVEEWIAEEMQKSNYQKDVNGLVYKVMAEGKGDKLENGQMVLVELIMTDVAGKSLVPTDVDRLLPFVA